MFQKHPVNAKINTSFASVGAGTQWPAGYNLVSYIDLFTNVKSLNFNLFSVALNGPNFGIASDALGAISLLQNAGGNDAPVLASGTSQRQVKLMGELKVDGTESLQSAYPFTNRNYPFFALGGLGVVATIDFGQTRFFNGLFFPKIVIQFSNGPSSNGAGTPIGLINFGAEGIAIYSGAAAGLDLVTGDISVNERYDSITVTKTVVKTGDSITFLPTTGNFDFSRIKYAYFGKGRAEVTASKPSLTVIVPPDAESGPVRFETQEPHFDSFTTVFDVIVSS